MGSGEISGILKMTTLEPIDINKDLMAASSTPMVLAILARGESYGYAILKHVQDVSEQRVTWTDGMLYPILHRLERLGYIKARWAESATGRRRRYYRITPRGRSRLTSELEQWRVMNGMLRGLSIHRLPYSPAWA